ncbi:MAG: flagellar hook-length control protein FliK [Thiohalomonadales bacterium]
MSSDLINLDTSASFTGVNTGPALLTSLSENPTEKQAFKEFFAQANYPETGLQKSAEKPPIDTRNITALNGENSTRPPNALLVSPASVEATHGSILPSSVMNDDLLPSASNDAFGEVSPLDSVHELESPPDLGENISLAIPALGREVTTVTIGSLPDNLQGASGPANSSSQLLTSLDVEAVTQTTQSPLNPTAQIAIQIESPLLQSRATTEANTLARPLSPVATSNEHTIVKELAGINVDDNRPVVNVDYEKIKHEVLSLDSKRNALSPGQQYTNADVSSQLNSGSEGRGNVTDSYNLFEQKSPNLLALDPKIDTLTSRLVFDLPVGLTAPQQTTTDSVVPKGFYQLVGQTMDSRWGEELGNKLHMLVQNNIQQAQFHINPKNLGPLDVFITLNQDQQVNIGFNVQQGALKDALDAALPRLREMLQEQGLNLNNVDIGQRNSGNDRQAPPQYQNVGGSEEDTSAIIENTAELVQSTIAGLGTVDYFA